MLWRVLAFVGVIWLILMPPLFTDGACTRQFDAEARRLDEERAAMATLAATREYWTRRGIEYQVLSEAQCRRARSNRVSSCGPGPTVLVEIPVENLVCKVYRDNRISVQLHYDQKERLARFQADMAPFKSLPLGGTTLHWAR